MKKEQYLINLIYHELILFNEMIINKLSDSQMRYLSDKLYFEIKQNSVYCSNCGAKLVNKASTDANSQLICNNVLCRENDLK